MSNKDKEKEKDPKLPQEEAPGAETAAPAQEPADQTPQKEPEAAAAPAQDTAASWQKELAAEKERHLRTLAEYDNFRKRSAKERENIYADVRADTVTKFLPVYDNLVRALAQATEDEAYRKGVEMIMTQLEEILTKLGVEEIPAVGEVFDPKLHNAVMHVEDESCGEGIIVEEFQKGFRMGDKVIRFSMVKVAN
jgi:molecular chaperone GrpE